MTQYTVLCADTEADGQIEGVAETMDAAFTAHLAVEATDTDELIFRPVGSNADADPSRVSLPP